jgi:hypothetical protein
MLGCRSSVCLLCDFDLTWIVPANSFLFAVDPDLHFKFKKCFAPCGSSGSGILSQYVDWVSRLPSGDYQEYRGVHALLAEDRRLQDQESRGA